MKLAALQHKPRANVHEEGTFILELNVATTAIKNTEGVSVQVKDVFYQ